MSWSRSERCLSASFTASSEATAQRYSERQIATMRSDGIAPVGIPMGPNCPTVPADRDTQCDFRQLRPQLATDRLDAEPGKNPGNRPREYYWDRQPHGSAKQCRVNLSGDDDIRDQR
jgi:hypothetical protein